MKRFIISCIGALCVDIACAGVMVLLGLPKALSFIIYEVTAVALIGTICFAKFTMAAINAYRMVGAEDKGTENNQEE